jgi:hypothetical protein
VRDAAQLKEAEMLTRLRDERGMAMVLSLLVAFVVLILSSVVVAQSIRTSNQSAYNRKRSQAVAAAEAGTNDFYALLTSVKIDDLECTPRTGTVASAPGDASYTVTPIFYEADGDPVPCSGDPTPFTDEYYPAAVLLESTGTVGGGAPRTIQTYLELQPILDGFDAAVITQSGLNLGNKLTLNGYGSTNADIYVNSGNLTVSNQPNIYGSIYVAQGTATVQNNSSIRGDLWAYGSVTMDTGAAVYGDVMSTTGSISVSNPARVYGDATAAGTIADSARIDGVESPNQSGLPSPPTQPLPKVYWDPQDWIDAGYTITTFNDCASAKGWLLNAANTNTSTKKVVRIQATCTLSFTRNEEVKFGGDLAIVTDGAISASNNSRFKGAHDLFLISAYRDGLNCGSGAYDVTLSERVSFEDVTGLSLYSPCTVHLDNLNRLRGQVIGGTVSVTNNFTMDFVPVLIPGVGDVVGFEQDIAYIREVRS